MKAYAFNDDKSKAEFKRFSGSVLNIAAGDTANIVFNSATLQSFGIDNVREWDIFGCVEEITDGSHYYQRTAGTLSDETAGFNYPHARIYDNEITCMVKNFRNAASDIRIILLLMHK